MSHFDFESHICSHESSGETDTTSKNHPIGAVGRGVKRAFDITFCIVAISAFSILMLVIACVIKYITRGPIFFCHDRVCADGRTFRCIKFRTMVADAQDRLNVLLASDANLAAEFAATHKLSDDPRIIPIIGHFLRKTSLDELPQFFNVLMGQMSVVGPRPVTLDEFREHYGSNHPYLKARPGITGLWQVSGRNDLTYRERVQMDAHYLANWSFSTDLLIVLKTVAIVCRDCNGR